jgi:hydrogenase nickel incorporation protein HypA/HybF
MHETSVCTALLDRVEAVALREGGRVSGVSVRIGPLSGVEPQLLARAFRAVCEDRGLGAPRLSIEHAPVRVSCLVCGRESEGAPQQLTCAACGAEDTRLVAGDELLLTGVDLLTPEAASGRAAADPEGGR